MADVLLILTMFAACFALGCMVVRYIFELRRRTQDILDRSDAEALRSDWEAVLGKWDER